MKTFFVDLDYESYLFDPNHNPNSAASLRARREFEYVYFLVQKLPSRLKNVRDYSSVYLDGLKKLGFVIPVLDPLSKDAFPWWGHHHDLEIEKKLNSKLTSSQIAQENNWGFAHGKWVQNFQEIIVHCEKHPQFNEWLLKHPHSFSGIGHQSFEVNNLDESKLKLQGTLLLEPKYKRVFDLGTTFLVNEGEIEDSFMVENYNSSRGAFRGGMSARSISEFKKTILEKYDFDLTELQKDLGDIAEIYLSLGAQSNIQIDSFIYEENGVLKAYPLVEVNYRKTMGLVLNALAEKCGEHGPVEWIIQNQKEMDEKGVPQNGIQLSPDGNQFTSFLVNSSDR